MNERIKRPKLIKKGLFKALKWLFISTGSLMVTVLLVLQLPYVQNRLFAQLLQHLSQKTEFSTTHEDFRLRWLHQVTLQGLTIKDPQGRTMLAVDEVALRINPIQLLLHAAITLPDSAIKGAQLHLRREQGADFNLNIWLKRLLGEGPATSPGPRVTIARLALQDLTLSIDDQQVLPVQDSFDWRHLTVHDIHAELANLTVRDDTWAVDILQLTAQHADLPLAIDQLSTAIAITPGQLQCQSVAIRTGGSTLQGNCTLTYDDAASPQNWIEQAYITAQLHQATLDAQEIGSFIPYFRQHQDTYTLKGQLAGRLPDLRIQDLQLGLGQRNHLHAHVDLKGLPHVQEAFFDVDLKHATVYAADVRSYLDEAQYDLVQPLSFVKTKGRFRGTIADFVAQAAFETGLGTVKTDLDFSLDPAAQCAHYKGAIETKRFALGALLQNDAIKTLSMQGEIDGQGLQLATAQFQLEANIAHLGIQDYDYQDIYTNGRFARQFFQGRLTINDPHLQLQADAKIDLQDGKEHVSLQGTLQQAALQPLRLTAEPITLSTQLTVALQGLSLDSAQGHLQLQKLQAQFRDKPIELEALTLHTDIDEDGSRSIKLDSTLCTAEVKGNFTYTALFEDIQHFAQAYARRYAHQAPVPHTPQPCTLTYRIHCKDINPLLQIAFPDLYLTPQTILQGSFVQHQGATLVLRLDQVKTLSFGQNHWNDIKLDLTTHQSYDRQNTTTKARLTSPIQYWSTGNTTSDFALTVDWNNDRIDFRHAWDDASEQHHIDLRGHARLLENTTEVTLTPYILQVAGQPWQIHPQHRIVIGDSWTQFDNLQFDNRQQTISLEGTLSADPDTTLHLKVRNLAIDNFNQLLNQSLAGQLNASIALRGTLRQPLIDSELILQNLAVNNTPIGRLHGQTHWNDAQQSLSINLQITHLEQQTVLVKGLYTPLQKDSLQLEAQFSHTPLATFVPLTGGYLSEVEGKLNGNLYVQGSPTQPQITGQATITDAALKVNYLNTHYQFEGTLTGTPQAIQLTNLKITDDQQGTATLQGALSYQGLQTPHVDLKGQLKQFKIMQNTAENDEYFHGTGLLNSTLSITGPINNVAIQANAQTAPGTQIIMLLKKNNSTVAQKDFIQFTNLHTPTKAPKKTTSLALKGIQITLMLEITPDAYAQLILDSKAKDTISGKGKGNLKLNLNNEGDLRLSGEILFVEGECQLSLYPPIRKVFKIQPGSKITWYDHPRQGHLDVRATYEQRVTLAPLAPEASPNLRKKYPVQVLMNLQGLLLNPDLQFDIQFPELPKEPKARTLANQLQEKIKTDESYLSLQVASLIIAKRFFNEESFRKSNNNTQMLSRSVSESISQQLSSLASGLNDNLDIATEWDLEELESKGLESLQLNVSYSLLDGRLKLSREGGISVEDKATQLLGNLTVEYSLTEDGRFKLKLYNKNITDPAQSTYNKGNALAGGFSLLYTNSFNRWLDLFTRKKNVKKEAPQSEGP